MLNTILRATSIALRDIDRLKLIHPPMADVIRDVLGAMERVGFPMMISDGVRTADQQFADFQKGRRLGLLSEPGAVQIGDKGVWVPVDPVRRVGIVTNADGFVKLSNHQARADGKGRAVDCVFVIDGPDQDGEYETPSWNDKQPWAMYGTLGEFLGKGHVRWLGRGPTLIDTPHLEWID